MTLRPFIFGGDTSISYEELQRRRKALQAAGRRNYSAKSIGEGLSALGHALRIRMEKNALNRAEKAGHDSFNTASGDLSGNGGFGSPAVTDSAPAPVRSDMPKIKWDGINVRDGIAATAQSLGVDPVDLATAISYETAGTFDPKKRGPTTQWGQHRGLIQFGEPQAKKYGVNWDDPVGSQLGPDGAIAKYLREAGVKPGMGLLDIYSAINAGGVGRYNRSDANNGGAPGSVQDKVEHQMAGHRAKAKAMFEGYQPSFQMPQAQPQQNPKARQQNSPYGGVDPLKQLQLQKMQLELERMQNPERNILKGVDGYQYYQDTGERVLPNIVSPQEQPAPTANMREFELAKAQGFQGSLQDQILGQLKAGATNVNENTGNTGPAVPAYNELPAGVVYKRDQNGQILIDASGVPTAVPITGGPGALEAEKQAAAEQAAQQLRDASPTGSALGNVSERELNFLQSAIGSPEQAQTSGDAYIDELLKKYGGQ